MDINIRIIPSSGLDEAVKLVTEVFMEFEAPDYSREGIRTFFDTALLDPEFMDRLTVYGAYVGDALEGVLATREKGRHIALFFVAGNCQRQGVGKALFQVALEHCDSGEMTVNSSPFAREIYHHLGFVDTDTEQTVTGIRFTPMIYRMTDGNG